MLIREASARHCNAVMMMQLKDGVRCFAEKRLQVVNALVGPFVEGLKNRDRTEVSARLASVLWEMGVMRLCEVRDDNRDGPPELIEVIQACRCVWPAQASPWPDDDDKLIERIKGWAARRPLRGFSRQDIEVVQSLFEEAASTGDDTIFSYTTGVLDRVLGKAIDKEVAWTDKTRMM